MPVGLLAEFDTLARETAPDKRVELLRRITDLYLTSTEDAATANRYLYSEIFSKVVTGLARDQKLQVSEDLSTRPALPEEIASLLATDPDAGIATPMLQHSDSLSERLLIDIATSGSQDHLTAIAQRQTVAPPVTDVMVTRGNRTVLSHLVGNAGAAFSDYGMDRLIAKAEDDVDLQELIVGRSDLSAEVVERLMPLLSDSLSESLRNRGYSFDRGSMRRHLSSWMDDRRKSLSEVDTLTLMIGRGDLTLDSAVNRLLASGRLLDVAAIISTAVKLDRRYTFNAMTTGPLQTALMIMRSAGLASMTAVEFVAQRQKKLKRREDDGHDIRAAYEAINPSVAQRVIRFLKVRQATMAN
jgi:hypothetical protein